MDVLAVPQRYVGRRPTVDICSYNHGSDNPDLEHRDRDTAMMADVILPLIGIVLIALIMVTWL